MPLDIVVLDACVLFPASLRDTLLRAAAAAFYQLRLSEDILEEVQRNLIQKRFLSERQAQHLISIIKNEFSETFVIDYRHLIENMQNDTKDRHVLAVAVASKANIIVTQNLRDFPQSSLSEYGIIAVSADAFLVDLFYRNQQGIARIIIEQAQDLHNPPKTVEELEATLAQHVPKFIYLVKQYLNGPEK